MSSRAPDTRAALSQMYLSMEQAVSLAQSIQTQAWLKVILATFHNEINKQSA